MTSKIKPPTVCKWQTINFRPHDVAAHVERDAARRGLSVSEFIAQAAGET